MAFFGCFAARADYQLVTTPIAEKFHLTRKFLPKY